MNWNEIIPWGRNRSVAARQTSEASDPFVALHREMNRVFDDFARGFGLGTPSRFGFEAGWPHLEVTETDAEVKVVAELPGLDEKDVELSLSDGVLTLAGEKRSESDGALYSERWHGKFQRSLNVGHDVDPDKVSAAFKNGVLTIALAKRPGAQSRVRRIAIANG